MVEIRLKTVECAQFNFRHRFWPKFFQFGRNATHDWFFCEPISAKFGQFGKISANFGFGSAKISGGNSTARIRPFLNEFRPFWPKTKLLCIRL
jgi:hypothetical protein